MAVRVKMWGRELEVERYEWRCPSLPELAVWLNEQRPEGGASGADPHPDLTLAQEATKKWGGDIIDEGEPPRRDPGVVY